jgi:tRNA(adenine34) deaminase
MASSDEAFMRLALRHAQHAYREKEVPIGAVIVDNNGIVVAASRNRVESEFDATAHAELDCMRKAAKIKMNWRLSNLTLYSTLEPCAMCMGAMQAFRIDRVVYGAKDIRLGACGSWIKIDENHPYHKIQISGGVLSDESSNLLKSFFVNRRKSNPSDYLHYRGYNDY